MTETTCYRHPDRRAGVRCQRCERPICPSCMSTASVGFHCPECARTGRQKVYTRATLGTLNRPAVTYVLIGINVAVFVAGLGSESRNAVAGRGGFIDDGGLLGALVADGEVWRIVTSGFLHAGVLHLLLNMWALYVLGSVLEPVLGRAGFAAVYSTSLLTGSLGVLVLQPDARTVGASGAVFGLMGALVMAQRARGLDPFANGIGFLLGINLLFTFTIPGISIGGHVGGLLGGLVSGWVLLDVGPKSFRAKWLPVAVVCALGVLAFGGGVLAASAS